MLQIHLLPRFLITKVCIRMAKHAKNLSRIRLHGCQWMPAGLRSLSSSSLQGKEPSVRNLMNCSSCSLQQGSDCYNTESFNFASTPLIDEDTLDTPLTSPNPTRGILRFCADAQQFQSHSTNANDFPGQFQAAFEASAADFSGFTIPSSFGLGELDWLEAPY